MEARHALCLSLPMGHYVAGRDAVFPGGVADQGMPFHHIH